MQQRSSAIVNDSIPEEDRRSANVTDHLAEADEAEHEQRLSDRVKSVFQRKAEPPAQLDRAEYEKAKKSLAAKRGQIAEMRRRITVLKSSVDVDTAKALKEEANQLWADGKIDSKTLKKKNAEFHVVMRDVADVEEACAVLDEKIKTIEEAVQNDQRQLSRMITALKRQHLDSMREDIDTEKFHAYWVWYRHVYQRDPDFREEFELPWHDDHVRPITETILSELDL